MLCLPYSYRSVIELPFAFSKQVDTEEEEEEEDKEDSPAPTDSVSTEFIDNIICRVQGAKKAMSVGLVLFDVVVGLVDSSIAKWANSQSKRTLKTLFFYFLINCASEKMLGEVVQMALG